MIRENIYIHLLYFYSHFLFSIHSIKMIFQILCWGVLIIFDYFWLIKILQELAYLSLIVKKLLLGLISISIIIAICRRITISFDSLLQLISGILSGLQKLLKYFDGTAIFAFFRIGPAWLEVGWASVAPNNLALYLKDLKPLMFSVPLFKLIASSFE